MHKSTIVFASLSIVLLITTGVVTYQLITHEGRSNAPLVGGASIDLGLPGVVPEGGVGEFTAGSVLLYDTNSGTILFEENAFERKPIASLTKLMTAMVALDAGFDWDDGADIQSEEYVQGGRLLLHPGEKVKMRDLFAASLVGSANNATLAYVRQTGIPKQEFIRSMNRKAVELGLEQTTFVDVTGLDPDNVSTAYEVAVMAQVAFTEYPEIAGLTARQEYTFVVPETEREHTIRNTNKLLTEWGEQLSGSKTGYLYEARYCLVAQGSGEHASRISVVLDSPSPIEHFADTKKLLYMNVQ